jgi:hypothetical protein
MRQLTDRGLPFYDDDTDAPLGGSQQQDLAETAGDVLLFRKRSSRSTRGAATEGLVHIGTDAKIVSLADGSEWIELQLLPAVTKTSSFPLDLSMLARVVETHSSTAIVVTVPPDVFPVSAVIQVDRLGEGAVTFAPGPGVVLRSTGEKRSITSQYQAVSLRQRAENEWLLVGALS